MLERTFSVRDGVRHAESKQADGEYDKRLAEFGFLFDPFRHLEASSDPHLFDYIVADNLPQLAWQLAPTIVFSPFGGGKTALRMFVTHDCWMRGGSHHPFPVHLLPQSSDLINPTPDGSWRPLARGLSKALLLAMLHRPLRFAELSQQEWINLLTAIAPHLPRPIAHYLSLLELSQDAPSLSESLETVRQLLDRSYMIPLAPDRGTLADLARRVEFALSQIGRPGKQQSGFRQSFEELATILNESLGFGEIFVLVDGVDAHHRDIAPPGRVADWLMGLLRAFPGDHEPAVVVKCFAPHLLELFLQPAIDADDLQVETHHLTWTPSSLSEMLRKRIAVATGGLFDSLAELGDPGVRNIEAQIAQTIQLQPQPREAIYLAGEILRTHLARRVLSSSQLINRQELNDVIGFYNQTELAPPEW